MELRDYQQEAVQAAFDFWGAGGGNPVIELPTGTGKSVVIAEILRRLRSNHSARAVCVTHVKELIEQNHAQIMRLAPDLPAGIYSAGLRKRQTQHPITFCGVQSTWRRPEVLGARDVCLIDEAHLIPHKTAGSYHALLNGLRRQNPELRTLGLTATPFRMASGQITEPYGDEPALFDQIIYRRPLSWFIERGYLAEPKPKPTALRLDVTRVAQRGGEFAKGELEAAVNLESINRAAVAEICALGADRRAWIVFAAGRAHCRDLEALLQGAGITAAAILGDTPADERRQLIAAFKAGKIRALISVDVLTTGFDAPGVDLVAMLRPTGSPGLLIQMIGRGLRLAPGKRDCLVLDFANNLLRHGPIDTIDGRKRPGGKGEPPAKACPACEQILAAAALVCKHCGHVFPPPKPKLSATAAAAPVMAHQRSGAGQRAKTDRLTAMAAESRAGRPMLTVTHWAGARAVVREYLLFDAPPGSYPRRQAECAWLDLGGAAPPPATVAEAASRAGELQPADALDLEREGDFYRIKRRYKMELA